MESCQGGSATPPQSTMEKLRCRREHERTHHTAETSEQRERKLNKHIMQDRAQHAAYMYAASQQTPEERVARLEQMREQQQERRAAETAVRRDVWL